MIETRAPGKLFIAGEYAVVEPGEPAVLVAVDRFLTVRLSDSARSDAGCVSSEEYGRAKRTWVRDPDHPGILHEGQPLDYVFSAIAVIEQLRAERGIAPEYFDLRVSSDLTSADGRKFGLGSSAAVTVAIIAALNAFYALGLTLTDRFKLALLATLAVAPRASGGDLAASTFGGWLRYTSPDRSALHDYLATHGVTATLAAPAWLGCTVKRLPPPAALQLLVGWTGSPASTDDLVATVQQPSRNASELYPAFVAESRSTVDDLIDALTHDAARAPAVILRARRLLQQLGEATGSLIETPKLAALCDIAERYGAAAKPSGAGGGDCGIVLADTSAEVSGILREWESHGIGQLTLSVHQIEGEIDAC